MKGLWRAIVLFMLPGSVLGGSAVLAFFRLHDGFGEPLKVLSAAAVVWTFVAYSSAVTAVKKHNTGRFYYPVCAIAGMALVLLTGVWRYLAWGGVFEGWTGVVISAAAGGWIMQSFASSDYSWRERVYLVTGVVLSGVVLFVAAWKIRLAWMETLFFYLTELLLICWAFASPLSCRGGWKKRWFWRGILLISVIAGVQVSPVFAYPAWQKSPESMPDGEWSKTAITVQGSRFIWMDKVGKYAYYTPDGRLVMRNEDDEALQGAIPGLLGIMESAYPKVLLAGSWRSVLPEVLKSSFGIKAAHHRLPESLVPWRSGWKRKLTGNSIADLTENNCDLLIISALPENQYPGVIRRFMTQLTGCLSSGGVTAVPAHLLKNPTMFSFLHEKFRYCGVLPAPGHLWVFSNRKLELQGKAIEEKLQLFYGADSPVQPGSYEALFSSNTMLPRFPEPPPAEELKLGNNRWQGKWWYLLAGAGLVMLWRMVRLFAERRNIMYSYWNALEHGYCAMGIFLLAMGLVIIHSGLFNFFTALMTLFFAAAFLKYHAWGFGGMLVALLGLLVLMQCSEWWSLLIACVIMLQTMLSGGGAGKMYSRSIAEERILNEAVFLGYFLAALSLAVVWYWQLPLLLIWGLLLTAVVGGILQNKRKRVYYNRGG